MKIAPLYIYFRKPIYLTLLLLQICTLLLCGNLLKAQNSLDIVGLSSTAPSATAYSLRKLSSTYTGNAMQVRRSSDNTTTINIIYNNNEYGQICFMYLSAGNNQCKGEMTVDKIIKN